MTVLTKPFFTLVFAIADIAPLVIAVDLIGILMLLFKERMEPRTFVMWLMIILVLPIAGFILYLMFGCTVHARRVFGRKRSAEAVMFDGESDDAPGWISGGAGAVRGSGGDIMTAGNDVRMIWSMDESLEVLLADMESAERSVHIEMRAIPKGEVGERIVGALEATARSGRDVRLLTDVRGFGRTPGVRRVRAAGGRFETFHNPLYSMFNIKNVNRNTRYISVIDGRVAYTGTDAVVRLEGPAAGRLERRFLADWAYAAGSEPEVPTEVPAQAGDDMVQIVSGGPDQCDGLGPMASAYEMVISSAERTLMVSMPYMVPDENMYNALRLARLSGVEVILVLPDHGKHWYQRWNSLSASSQMMSSGVRVYFAQRRTGRCVMVADGRLLVVGSSPFSILSMTRDFSTAALVCSEEVASSAENEFRRELESAAECSPDDYKGRSFADRVKVGVARVMMFFN